MLRVSNNTPVSVIWAVAISGWLVATADCAQVAGVLRDPTGAPVAGASVSVLPGNTRQAVSDANGRYALEWDPTRLSGEDAKFCLLARHPQRNLAAAVEMSAGTRAVDVKLERGLILRGKVVDPNGRGIAEARVQSTLRMSYWEAFLTPVALVVEADGTFVWTGFPRDQTCKIHAEADGYGRVISDVELAQPQGDNVDLGTITLPVANLSIAGRVVDVDGNPVPGVRLHANAEGQPEGLFAAVDDTGKFVLESVCAGVIVLYADASHDGKRLSGRLATEGGATGVRMVVHAGRSQLQYHSIRTYEQIVADSAKVIAGVTVDERGAPVPDVIVSVRCHKTTLADGRSRWSYSSSPLLGATTDQQGRFAIAFEEDGEYSLLFTPDRHAATIVYDIPPDTRDVKVTLEKGGTIGGRLLQLDGMRKVPIPNVEVRLEQNSRLSYSHLGFDRDQTTRTDDQGCFRFERIGTRVRPNSSRNEVEWTAVSRIWQLVYEDTIQTFAFTDGLAIEDFELLVKPRTETAAPLVGNRLPSFEGIAVELFEEQTKGQAMLLCFFDYQQRPSRNTVMQLVRQAEALKQEGLMVAVIQAAQTERAALAAWVKDNNVSFPVGTITADIEATRGVWRVQSLPWLILSDEDHIVRAEGFGLDELRAKIEEMTDARP
ncbi:MAG: carboxypeptidase regulatory-like domain-containing protein [Sedimentisphaerales bacterium]|nr:carboxypeptidase regulatory-like domain-containing protein [Sedimentisphaerales bacterium]